MSDEHNPLFTGTKLLSKIFARTEKAGKHHTKSGVLSVFGDIERLENDSNLQCGGDVDENNAGTYRSKLESVSLLSVEFEMVGITLGRHRYHHVLLHRSFTVRFVW